MSGTEHRTFNIQRSTSNEGKKGKKKRRGSREAVMEAGRELTLLLDEVELLQVGELFKIYHWKEQCKNSRLSDVDLARMLEMAIRLLEPRKNRTIKEAAILAYAEKKLEELGEIGYRLRATDCGVLSAAGGPL